MMTFTFDKKDPASFPFNSIMISAVIERKNDQGEIEILFQTRANNNDSVYFGTLEIPAGHIEKYENVYEALKREVLEETGLHVSRILGDMQTAEISGNGEDAAFCFQPFVCQQYLKGKGWAWLGFSFRCEVEGKLRSQEGETKDHQWIALPVLKQMLDDNPSQFFTLHLPVLTYLVSFHEKAK